MDLTPEERQHIFEEEKARLEAQEKLKAEAEKQKSHPLRTGCLAVIGGIILLFIIGLFSKGGSNNPTHDKTDARYMAEVFVKKQLKSPSSAEFSGIDETTVIDNGNNAFTVVGWVDAENSFGAKLRNKYYCKLHWVSGDTWHCDDVSLE